MGNGEIRKFGNGGKLFFWRERVQTAMAEHEVVDLTLDSSDLDSSSSSIVAISDVSDLSQSSDSQSSDSEQAL